MRGTSHSGRMPDTYATVPLGRTGHWCLMKRSHQFKAPSSGVPLDVLEQIGCAFVMITRYKLPIPAADLTRGWEPNQGLFPFIGSQPLSILFTHQYMMADRHPL